MWPQRWLGVAYSRLYSRFREGRFTSGDIVAVAGTREKAKAIAARLQKAGLMCRHSKRGRKMVYRLIDPETLVLMASGLVSGLTRIRQQVYRRLAGLACSAMLRDVQGLHSVVLYGSVARGRAKPESDLDLLVVADFTQHFAARLDALIRLERSRGIAEELSILEEDGIRTHLSFLPLTVRELEAAPPILLDIVDEGIPLLDDDAFSRVALEVTRRLRSSGARRVFIGEDDWYWDLKPDYVFGEVIQV